MGKDKTLPYITPDIYGDLDDYQSWEDYEIELDRLADFENRLPHRVNTDDSSYYDAGWDSDS